MTDITPVSSIPVSVDYTDRDFYSLRNSMIAIIQKRLGPGVWLASDPSDFGVALVESFAYMGDVLSYYIDRAANESSIATATQRDNVLSLANEYGYSPAGYRSAFVTLTFTNTDTNDIVLPEGTVVTAFISTSDVVQIVYFTTTAEVTVGGVGTLLTGPFKVSATEGRSVSLVATDLDITYPEYGELIGESNQTSSQVMPLNFNPVVAGSIEVWVQDGAHYSKWTEVEHLIDYGISDQVYSVSTDENDIVYIEFGDGVSGAIPTLNSAIRAQYLIGGGNVGNVGVGLIDSFSYVPGVVDLSNYNNWFTITNEEVGIGGSSPESTNSIRISAPLALRSGNRAVTLEDFESLAFAVTNVGKAKATASVWTSVTMYIAPVSNPEDAALQPGLDDTLAPTVDQVALQESVSSYLEDKLLLGTSVTISPPTYLDIYLTLQYVPLPLYTNAQVEANIKRDLLNYFSYSGMKFGDTLYPQDFEFIASQSIGVKNAKVLDLFEQGGSGLNILTGDEGTIYRLQEGSLTLTT